MKGKEERTPAPPFAFCAPHGVATFYRNGLIVPPVVIDVLPDTDEKRLHALAQSSRHLYRIKEVELGWLAPFRFDYAALETRLAALLEADPQAAFWLEVSLDAPDWWRQSHPVELVRYCLPAEKDSNDLPCVSWASGLWQKEAGDALFRLTRHLFRSPWRAHCIGIQIAWGEEGAWRHPAPERLPDIGPRMQEAFQQFVRAKYRRNTALLRNAWKNFSADFDTARCPAAAERRRADVGILRGPARSRRILDYYECFYQAQTDAVLHFARLVKRASDNQASVGIQFATLFGTEHTAEGSYAYPEPVLDAADLDFFIATLDPEGCCLTLPMGSLHLRRKFVFCSVPASHRLTRSAPMALSHQAGLILSADTADTHLAEICRVAEEAVRDFKGARHRQGSCALIVDAPNLLCLGSEASWLNAFLLTAQQQELARTGAAFDVYLLSDLFRPDFHDHKLTIFANIFYLTEAERRRIEARVKRSGQVVVWAWGCGVIAESGISAEAGQQMSGLRQRMELESAPLSVRVVTTEDALTREQRVGTTFGVNRAVAPRFVIGDKHATRLGVLANNKTGFAARRFETWTSVVSGAVPIPAAVLVGALREAGCHLYIHHTQGSLEIQADMRSVSLYSPESAGQVTLSLPGPHDVRDLWTQEALAEGVSELLVTLAPGATRYLGIVRRNRT